MDISVEMSRMSGIVTSGPAVPTFTKNVNVASPHDTSVLAILDLQLNLRDMDYRGMSSRISFIEFCDVDFVHIAIDDPSRVAHFNDFSLGHLVSKIFVFLD